MTVTLEGDIYHIKHGDKARNSPSTYRSEATICGDILVAIFQETGFKKRLPFDVPTLSSAWDCYWVEQEGGIDEEREWKINLQS